MQTPGSTTAGGVAGPRSGSRRRRAATSATISRPSAARLKPTSATANDTSGDAAELRQRQQRPSVWPKPTTPQGNPPNGTVDFSHSATRPHRANHSGQPGSRAHHDGQQAEQRRGTARTSAASASQGTGARPDADPRQQRHVERQPEQEAVAEPPTSVVAGRVSTQASSANATTAAHHQPTAGSWRRAAAGHDGDRQPRQPRHQRGLHEPASARRARLRVECSASSARVALVVGQPGRRGSACAGARELEVASSVTTAVRVVVAVTGGPASARRAAPSAVA